MRCILVTSGEELPICTSVNLVEIHNLFRVIQLVSTCLPGLGSPTYIYEGCYSNDPVVGVALDGLIVGDMEDNSINTCG